MNIQHSPLRRKLEVIGWCIFDFANSSYTTIIITVCFNVVFAKLIVGPTGNDPTNFSRGNLIWSVVLSIAWICTALVGPLFGALSDLSHRRKAFLVGSVAACVFSTAGLYAIEPGNVFPASTFVILSCISFGLSENFISAFLPHISNSNNIGIISGFAWGIGYFGGLGSIILCQWFTGFEYTIENYPSLRLIGPITAAFFLVGSLPTFIFVPEPKTSFSPHPKLSTISNAYHTLFKTISSINRYQDLARFLLANFFFQGGVAIVISFTALYADQVVGIQGSWQAALFITLQLSAAAGAFLFGILQHQIGAIRAINMTLLIWISTVLLIFFLPSIAAVTGWNDLRLPFVLIGNMAGLCLGATQSCTRALVGMFSPREKSGEFFGFWGFSGKIASVFAVILFGVLQSVFSIDRAILFCSLLFGMGLLLNQTVNEKRGKEVAAS